MSLSRRTVFGLGGSLAALTLAGCGQNSGSLDTRPSSSGAAGKPGLTQWYHEYGEEGVQDAVGRYASEYPDATVKTQWNPGDYGKLLNAALLTDDVPDVFEAEQGGSIDMIKAGQLADLTDLVSPVANQFHPAVMKRFTYEGKLHSIPQTIDMHMLYYRPSVLKKAGVQPPKTFAELVSVAKAVKTPDMGGFFAGNDGGIGVLGTLLIWASGNEQFNQEHSAPAFLTQSFYDAVTGFRDFFHSGGLLQSASAEWYAPGAFINGETAMQWGGLWSLTEIQKELGDDVGIIPFPAIGAQGRPAILFGAFGACVAAKGRNVEAAKRFVKWLWIDSEDRQVDFSNSYGTHIPAKTALSAKADKISTGLGAEATRLFADHGFANDILWSGPLGDAYSAALTKVVKNSGDPRTEFGAVGERAVAELQRIKG